MIIAFDKYREAYRKIKNDSLSTGTPVLIFSAGDVDALCSLRILTSLFKADNIPYTIKPVQGYSCLEEQKQAVGNARSVILINCGGIVDILSLLGLENNEEITVYVSDSHRPLHLENVYSEGQVLLFALDAKEEDFPQKLSPEDLEDSDLDFLSDQDGTDSDGDGVDMEGTRKRRRTEVGGEGSARSEARLRREKYEKYYKSSWYGNCSAGQMYQLAAENSKESNDFLWMWIIGLHDLYVHERIDHAQYAMETSSVKQEVDRHNLASRQAVAASQSTPVDQGLDDEINFNPEEMRLMLISHWTVWDSMANSSYVASRLGLGKNSNIDHEIGLLLAKIGVPIEVCKQNFRNMAVDMRRKLVDGIKQHAGNFNLQDVFFASFSRRVGFGEVATATDEVFRIAALLDEAHAHINTAQADPGSNSQSNWEMNFWRAYDALDPSRKHLRDQGIRASIRVQQCVVETARNLIARKIIQAYGRVRVGVITDPVGLLTEQTPLLNLALFLNDSLRERNKPKKPLLLAIQRGDMYLAVGIPGSDRFGDVEKNDFGHWFRRAAEVTAAKIKLDGFDMSVVEVLREYWPRFVEAIHAQELAPSTTRGRRRNTQRQGD